MTFKERCSELEKIIQDAYTKGVSMSDAEAFAAQFLHAQIQVSSELRTADLDVRMRKTGVKGVKAALYLDIAQSSDKKPTETFIDNKILTNALYMCESDKYDRAEVEYAELERYYNIFREAHVFFRGIARGVQG